MTTQPRKICMLGEFGVGKTSLVARYVRNTFSDRYLSTVGVKVDSKTLDVPGEPSRRLVIWDIEGNAGLTSRSSAYLRGSSGLLLVADGMRAPTLRVATRLLDQARELLPGVPAVLIVNKLDLLERWEVSAAEIARVRETVPVHVVSARTGDSVEAAFSELASLLP